MTRRVYYKMKRTVQENSCAIVDSQSRFLGQTSKLPGHILHDQRVIGLRTCKTDDIITYFSGVENKNEKY